MYTVTVISCCDAVQTIHCKVCGRTISACYIVHFSLSALLLAENVKRNESNDVLSEPSVLSCLLRLYGAVQTLPLVEVERDGFQYFHTKFDVKKRIRPVMSKISGKFGDPSLTKVNCYLFGKWQP